MNPRISHKQFVHSFSWCILLCPRYAPKGKESKSVEKDSTNRVFVFYVCICTVKAMWPTGYIIKHAIQTSCKLLTNLPLPVYQKQTCKGPLVAESRSQSSDLMRDFIFLFLIICMQKQEWIFGGGGRSRWWDRVWTSPGMSGVTLWSALLSGSKPFNCIFRHFGVTRLPSRALGKVWKRTGSQENTVIWNKSAYKIRR